MRATFYLINSKGTDDFVALYIHNIDRSDHYNPSRFCRGIRDKHATRISHIQFLDVNDDFVGCFRLVGNDFQTLVLFVKTVDEVFGGIICVLGQFFT